MAKFILFSIVSTIFILSINADVPSYLKVCGRQDPQINDCVKQSIHGLKIKLKNGMPEYDVPSMETITLDEVVLADIPDFRTVATNAKLRGIADLNVKQINVDLKNENINLEVVIPRINMVAEYNVQAKIIVPINEKGPISMYSDNVVAQISLKLKKVNRHGRQMVYIPKMTLKLIIPDYVANFNPNGESNPLNQAINAVLIDSKKEIIDSLTPNIEKALSGKILDFINQFCKNFTYDELFPDRT